MRNSTTSLLFIFLFVASGCSVSSGIQTPDQNTLNATQEADAGGSPMIPTLRQVGTRGWFVLDGPFAEFDPTAPSVEIWTPDGDANAPVIVYAHGGAGYSEEDRARVAMFRRNGFATISFDAYLMNGIDNWRFVIRKVANISKQKMIWGVFNGAVSYAATHDGWDNRNIFLYGTSNGGRVVLYAGSEIENENVRGIISEAPAGSGFALDDYSIPTIIIFGALDTWGGKSNTDFVWTRTYPGSPLISIKDWVDAEQVKGRPVKFIFYENAGHLLFEGPLELVTEHRGKSITFTAYRGAAEGVLDQYERDVMSFVRAKLVQ